MCHESKIIRKPKIVATITHEHEQKHEHIQSNFPEIHKDGNVGIFCTISNVNKFEAISWE